MMQGRPSWRQPIDSLTVLEEDAVEKLMIRRSLLLVEDGWSRRHMIEIFMLAGKNGREARGPPELGLQTMKRTCRFPRLLKATKKTRRSSRPCESIE
ncbi:hypothetical protein C1H46_036904 [Malus baccata]|uniref:Uncharacterized protein n=1 Tax=Malus baccata TaxID=106549 RepID=A0A540KTK0_MALBA|nr:hypothetical protein C1H46_036904 [Malus baccata]